MIFLTRFVTLNETKMPPFQIVSFYISGYNIWTTLYNKHFSEQEIMQYKNPGYKLKKSQAVFLPFPIMLFSAFTRNAKLSSTPKGRSLIIRRVERWGNYKGNLALGAVLQLHPSCYHFLLIYYRCHSQFVTPENHARVQCKVATECKHCTHRWKCKLRDAGSPQIVSD